MAAPMDNVRIKLHFPHSGHLCWFLINKEGINTIKDVEKLIATKYALKRKLIELYLDECWLPTAESVHILRDNDNIQVRIKKKASERYIDTFGKDLTQRTSDESVTIEHKLPLPNDCVVLQVKDKKKRKKERVDIETITNYDYDDNIKISSDTEAKETKPKKKRRKDKEQEEDMSSCASVVETQLNYPAKRLNDTVVKSDKGENEKDIDKQMEIVSNDTPSKEENTKRKRVRRRRKKVISQDPNVTPLQTTNAECGSQITLNVGSDPAYQGPKEYPRNLPNKRRSQKEGPNYIRFDSDDDTSPVKDKRPINERMEAVANGSAALYNNRGKSEDGNRSVHSALDFPQGDSVQTEKTDIASPSNTPPPIETHASNVQPSVSETSVDYFLNHDVPGYIAIPPPTSLNLERQNNSWQSKKKLPRPAEKLKCAQVFNRRRYKKEGFYPLSKEEQLNTMATNKSVILQNEESPPGDGPHVPEDKDEAPKPDPIDVSKLTLLVGSPRIGDTIVYKVLEMSESYTPEVSDFRQAKVVEFNPATQELGLELLHARAEKKKPGIFDLVVEDDAEILTNVCNETRITVHRNSLMDVHLAGT